MASISDLKKALDILAKYEPDGDWHSEHDQSWFPGPEEVSKEDAAALDALGFFWCEEGESWSCFN